MYFESAFLSLLLLCTYATVGSTAPVGDSGVSRRQYTEWCGEFFNVCQAIEWVEAGNTPCSADVDPTGTCVCPANGPVECPVTDPTWRPFQLAGSPPLPPNKKRSITEDPTIVEAEIGSTALVRRDHTYIKTKSPLHDAIKVIGINILKNSVTNIVVNKLDRDLAGRIVTGLAGKLSQAIKYNGISLPAGAPWAIRWDWDPVNLVHVNLDIGKPNLVSILFQIDGPDQNTNYFNSVVDMLSQRADWPAIVTKMFPGTGRDGAIDWPKALDMQHAMTAVGTSLADILSQVVIYWTNLYNLAEEGSNIVTQHGGTAGRHD